MEPTLGNRLCAWRVHCSLTQEQVADACGYTKQCVSNWENDKSAPSQRALAVIVALFNTTLPIFWSRVPKKAA